MKMGEERGEGTTEVFFFFLTLFNFFNFFLVSNNF